MNILLDIVHPAHVHFFRNPISILENSGHSVTIASRAKDCTLDLLDELGLCHICISRQNSGGFFAMARELYQRDKRLSQLAKEHKCDVIAGVGGVAAAQASRWLGIDSVVFYDTEEATLQNALTYPFAKRVVVPECYAGWTPRRKTKRYRGYHEMSYLHPMRFQPDRRVAIRNGLATTGDTFFIRLVSWQANHDVGLEGWSKSTLDRIVEHLSSKGRVIISSEQPLPEELSQFRYRGERSMIHHLVGHCRLTIGESATMASESVVMGVPAIYAAPSYRGYVSEQEGRYGMAKFIREPGASALISAIDQMLSNDPEDYQRRHARLVSECVDVAKMVSHHLCGEEDEL